MADSTSAARLAEIEAALNRTRRPNLSFGDDWQDQDVLLDSIPWLLAEVRRLTAERDQLHAQRKWYIDQLVVVAGERDRAEAALNEIADLAEQAERQAYVDKK